MTNAALAKQKADENLPDVKQRRQMLEQQITQVKQSSFSLFIQAEYTRVQGVDEAGRKQAKEQSSTLDDQRTNLLKGLTRLQELLKDLPEPDLEVEGAD